jgi:hypothetical protein
MQRGHSLKQNKSKKETNQNINTIIQWQGQNGFQEDGHQRRRLFQSEETTEKLEVVRKANHGIAAIYKLSFLLLVQMEHCPIFMIKALPTVPGKRKSTFSN